MRGKPKKGKRAKRRQRRIKRACFEEGPRFSGAKHTETGWADGVFLHHAGRKDFFDTLKQTQDKTRVCFFVLNSHIPDIHRAAAPEAGPTPDRWR